MPPEDLGVLSSAGAAGDERPRLIGGAPRVGPPMLAWDGIPPPARPGPPPRLPPPPYAPRPRAGAAPPPVPLGPPSPPPTKPPATAAKPTSLNGALQALQAAVTSAANSGALATRDARDFQQLIDDVRQALADGKTKDLAHKLADFTRRLQDVQHQGNLSPQAYGQILAAVQSVQALQATSGGQQEGD